MNNLYCLSVFSWTMLWNLFIYNNYKLDHDKNLSDIDKDARNHAHSLDIADIMECHSRSSAFLAIKDHKEDFPNTIKYRVINPARNNLGKISKRVLDKINSTCRESADVNQWKNTQDVLRWFTEIHGNNPTKKKGRFVQFDIFEFYPSISEELLRNSLDYAKTHVNVDDEEVDMIMACRKSVLFNDGKTWTKKNKNLM